MLDSLGDGNAQAAGAVWILGQHLAAKLGLSAWTAMHRCAICLNEELTVWLLVKANLDHENGALQAKDGTCKCQGRTPLSRARFRSQTLCAGDLVIESLWNCGVRLVAAGWAYSLVLVVDVRRRLQRFFKAHGSNQGRRAIERIDVANFLRNFDRPLGAHLLSYDRLREKREHQVRGNRLTGSRMQWRGQLLREIRQKVIPGLRHFICRKKKLYVVAHRLITSSFALFQLLVIVPDVAEDQPLAILLPLVNQDSFAIPASDRFPSFFEISTAVSIPSSNPYSPMTKFFSGTFFQ